MFRLLSLILLLTAAPVAAATVTEVTDYSDDWFAPTQIAAGTTQLNGVVDDLDVLQLQGLAAGAQTLRFTFSAAPYYTSGNYTAGGSILARSSAFRFAWDSEVRADYQVSYNTWNVGTPWPGQSGALTSSVDLVLGSDFKGGILNLALVPWNGLPLSYGISYASTAASSAPQVSAVPLPLSGVLLGGVALLGLGLRRRRG